MFERLKSFAHYLPPISMALSGRENTQDPNPSFSGTELGDTSHGYTRGSHLWRQAQAWVQSIVEWVTAPAEDDFFSKLQQDQSYHHYRAWRRDWQWQIKQLFQAIVAHYREGKVVSPEQLRDTLLAQQTSFDANTVSPLYYDARLKRLAQRLSRYAHALEGIATHFRDDLKAHPEQAHRYFYNDTLNQLLDSYFNGFTQDLVDPTSRVSLTNRLGYYQGLVSEALFQAVREVLVNTQVQATQANCPDGFSHWRYQKVINQLNALFLPVLAPEDQITMITPAGVSSLAGLNDLLTDGWRYLKAHPKAALGGTAGTVLGAGTLYLLSQEGMASTSSSWLDKTQSLATFSPVTSLFPFLLATGCLSLNDAPYRLERLPIWKVAVPLIGLSTSLPSVAAQPSELWIRGFDGGEGSSVQPTADGGCIVTGYRAPNNRPPVHLLLSKWTANGTVSWVGSIGGEGEESGYSVQVTADGGYIAAGNTNSFGVGGWDLLLSKWTADGTASWVKTLGGTGNDYGYSVQLTADGGYIVTGNTNSFGGLWLSKWMENGTVSWVRTLDGGFGRFVQLTADGGYIVVGYGFGDLLLSKWTATGDLSWVKTLGGPGDDRGYSVQPTADGSYIVSGATQSFASGWADWDLWLSKWTANGTVSWVKTLGGSTVDRRFLTSTVQPTADGGYIVVGTSPVLVGGSTNLCLSKLTANGTVSWFKTLSDARGRSVQLTADGDYIVTGSRSTALLLSKWDSLGNTASTGCVSTPPIVSVAVSVTPADVTITPGTPSVEARSVEVSAQTVNATLLTICNETLPPPLPPPPFTPCPSDTPPTPPAPLPNNLLDNPFLVGVGIGGGVICLLTTLGILAYRMKNQDKRDAVPQEEKPTSMAKLIGRFGAWRQEARPKTEQDRLIPREKEPAAEKMLLNH